MGSNQIGFNIVIVKNTKFEMISVICMVNKSFQLYAVQAAEIKKFQRGTGGGPPPNKQLNSIETIIVDIMGETVIEGLF